MRRPTTIRGLCRVEGCGRAAHAKQLCASHYQRWWKTGATGSEPIRPRRAPMCSLEGCDAPHDALSYCARHYYLMTRYGLDALEPSWEPPPPSRFDAGAAHPQWAAGDVSYQGAHSRLERDRGRPGNHTCVRCAVKTAAHWVLRRDARAAGRADPRTGWIYSSDPLEYDALCNPCRRLVSLELEGQPFLPGLGVDQ